MKEREQARLLLGLERDRAERAERVAKGWQAATWTVTGVAAVELVFIILQIILR